MMYTVLSTISNLLVMSKSLRNGMSVILSGEVFGQPSVLDPKLIISLLRPCLQAGRVTLVLELP